jgi:hypothetical protein
LRYLFYKVSPYLILNSSWILFLLLKGVFF